MHCFKRFKHSNTLNVSNLKLKPIHILNQPKIPKLQHDLDKVLFNPGIHFIKDPRTNIYNFVPFLEHLISIKDFNFDLIPKYIPSGKDEKLSNIAQEHNCKYTSSTSSLTSVLVKFHNLISHDRPPNILNISKNFYGKTTDFTQAQKRPSSIFLTRQSTKTFSIDQDQSQSTEMILTILGNILETFLTTTESKFKLFHKENKSSLTQDKMKPSSQNTYNYSQCGGFMMRSQLDCKDSRLPNGGVFDLKTRAVCAVRHDLDYVQINDGTDYQIKSLYGKFESFEREWYDLIRSTMLKYSLQARIGRMDGIFLAYHNIRKFFGFEYVPLSRMDEIFHQYCSIAKTPIDCQKTGEQEFLLSIGLLESCLNKILNENNNFENFNIVFANVAKGELAIFVKPMKLDDINKIQNSGKEIEIINDYEYGSDPNTIWWHVTRFNPGSTSNIPEPKSENLKSELKSEHASEPVESVETLDSVESASQSAKHISKPASNKSTLKSEIPGFDSKLNPDPELNIKSDSSEPSLDPDSKSNTDPDELPIKQHPDIHVYRLLIENHINGRFIPLDEHPAICSYKDNWKINYDLQKLTGLKAIELLNKSFASKPYTLRELTSNPKTSRGEPQDDLLAKNQALSLLESPSSLQKKLRALSKQQSFKILKNKKKIVWNSNVLKIKK